jgi:hypothetical protein
MSWLTTFAPILIAARTIMALAPCAAVIATTKWAIRDSLVRQGFLLAFMHLRSGAVIRTYSEPLTWEAPYKFGKGAGDARQIWDARSTLGRV